MYEKINFSYSGLGNTGSRCVVRYSACGTRGTTIDSVGILICHSLSVRQGFVVFMPDRVTTFHHVTDRIQLPLSRFANTEPKII